MKQLLVYITCLLWIWAPLIHSAPLSVFLSGGVGSGVTPPEIVTSEITWISSSGNNFTTISPTVNYPAVLQNDIMIAIFASDSTHTISILPLGWTSLGTVSHTSGGTPDGSLTVCWKRASSDEPATEAWTNFFTGVETGRVVVITYRNCISSGDPFNSTVVGPSDDSFGPDTAITGTSTVINTVALYIIGGDIQSSSSITWGSGITLRIDATTTPAGNNGTVGAIIIGEKALPTIGSVTMSGVLSAGVSSHSKILLILKPNPAS